MKGRELPQRNLGRYWLTMSDAAVFTSIQTIYVLAEKLRNDLADKTGVLAKRKAAELGLILASAAEGAWGRGKAGQLVAQIVDLEDLDPARTARVYALIGAAMSALPLTLWPQEKQSVRRELLDELNKHMVRAQIDVPRQQSKIEAREKEWRATLASMREPDAEEARK